jgi:hypothetical protein
MKIQIGKRYVMHGYPVPYKYVQIVCKERDLGIRSSDLTVEIFLGVIMYDSPLGLTRYPDACSWGENGEWDGCWINDSSALVAEYEETKMKKIIKTVLIGFFTYALLLLCMMVLVNKWRG